MPSLPPQTILLHPCTATSFRLLTSQTLTIITPHGAQVADLLAFNAHDVCETLSNGRTFDYNKTIRLSTGNTLYSNRSNALLRIGEDTVVEEGGRHDFLITPCSRDTFRELYPKNSIVVAEDGSDGVSERWLFRELRIRSQYLRD